MLILPQTIYNSYLNKLIDETKEVFSSVVDPTNQSYTIRNYTNSIEKVSDVLQELGRNIMVELINKMDLDFKNSPNRLKSFYVKDTRERTIITPVGVITYRRTIYQCRSTKSCFTYVDRKLGLPRYDKYDPCVKAMIAETHATQNSMIKTGELVGQRIFSIFSTKEEKNNFNISRQTVHNVLKNIALIKPSYTEVENTPSDIYIMADEKYVHLQGEPSQVRQSGLTVNVMVKQAVIYDDIETQGKRNTLQNRIVYSSIDGNFWNNVLDIISQRYDIDKIQNIHISGDGAKWITASTSTIPKSIYYLDKFHYKQALRLMLLDADDRWIAESYINGNNKKDFKKIAESLILLESNEHRSESAISKMDYIKNNWNAIQRSLQPDYHGCGMEGQISHNLAAPLTSRPKAYARENLRRYLILTDGVRNGVDLMNLYLDTFDLPHSNKHVTVSKEEFDFSMFEQKNSSDKSSTSNWLKGFISQN